MKRCPNCRRDYVDETLVFCLDDGEPLVDGPGSAEGLNEQPTRLLAHEIVSPKPSSPARLSFASWLSGRYLGLALAFIALVVLAGYFYLGSPQTRSINSIAVLPFENASGSPDLEYLSDGMTETLIGRLSQLPNLNVKAPSTVFRYKGKENEVARVAIELGVDAVLTGRVVQRGEELAVFLSIVDGSTENNLWSKQYSRKLNNLVTLQAEIARDVSESVRGRITGSEGQKIAKNYTENADAYQLYLKGRFHVGKITPTEVQRGIDYFQEAIKVDPGYALAYAGLAEAYRTLPLGPEMSPSEYFPKAKETARKALEMDPTLAEARAVLCYCSFWYDWDWEAAEGHCRKGLDVNPKSSEVLMAYAHLLSSSGRHAEALDTIGRAREIDPLNVRIGALEGMFLLHAGEPDQALISIGKTLELDPNNVLSLQTAAGIYIELGRFDDAMAAAQRGRELHPTNSRAASFFGYALAKTGKTAEARALAESIVAQSREGTISPYNVALIYQGLGDKEAVFRWLEKGLEQKDPRMTFLLTEPKWNSLRSDPQFQSILMKAGFTPVQ